MSTTEPGDLYERLRQRVTEGRPGRGDGLAVLRRQGLNAWIAHVTAAPPRPARAAAPRAPATELNMAASELSPLVCLCTNMLLATLAPKEVR